MKLNNGPMFSGTPSAVRPANTLAQTMWEEYVVNTGLAMPEGLADEMAAAVIRRFHVVERTLPLDDEDYDEDI